MLFRSPEEIFTSEYIQKLYGITRGSYNAAFGCVEMDPPRGEPQVFVIGGKMCIRDRFWELH